MAACNTQTVAVKPEGIVDIIHTNTFAAQTIFSTQERRCFRSADIRLHEKSRDTLAAMGAVAARGQHTIDYIV